MRQVLLGLFLIFVIFTINYKTESADQKEEAVPAVIEAKGIRLGDRQNMIAERLNDLHNSNHWVTQEEWMPIFFQNEMVVAKINSAAYEYMLCKDTKQGYYCDQSLEDLKQAEYELDKLDKEIEKASTTQL